MTYRAIRHAAANAEAHSLIASALPEIVGSLLEPAELETIRQRLAKLPEPPLPAPRAGRLPGSPCLPLHISRGAAFHLHAPSHARHARLQCDSRCDAVRHRLCLRTLRRPCAVGFRDFHGDSRKRARCPHDRLRRMITRRAVTIVAVALALGLGHASGPNHDQPYARGVSCCSARQRERTGRASGLAFLPPPQPTSCRIAIIMCNPPSQPIGIGSISRRDIATKTWTPARSGSVTISAAARGKLGIDADAGWSVRRSHGHRSRLQRIAQLVEARIIQRRRIRDRHPGYDRELLL